MQVRIGAALGTKAKLLSKCGKAPTITQVAIAETTWRISWQMTRVMVHQRMGLNLSQLRIYGMIAKKKYATYPMVVVKSQLD